MVRKARIDFKGAVYHVLDCRDRREPIPSSVEAGGFVTHLPGRSAASMSGVWRSGSAPYHEAELPPVGLLYEAPSFVTRDKR